MTEEQQNRFRDLAVKEAIQTITTRELREFNRLQRILHREFDAQMDISDPGWRKRDQEVRRKTTRLIKRLEELISADEHRRHQG